MRPFWLLTYLLSFAACSPFFLAIEKSDLRTGLYATALWITYPLVYLLPAITLTWFLGKLLLGKRILGMRSSSEASSVWARRLVGSIAVLTATATIALLWTDHIIFDIYGFHINGFVLNLVMTEGGMASMGAGQSTYLVVAGGCLALLLALSGALKGSRRLPAKALPNSRWLVLLFLISLGERVAYGMAHVQGHIPTLMGAEAFPIYSRLTFNSLAADLGFEVSRLDKGPKLGDNSGVLRYPLRPLALKELEQPPNIVWIAVESWRSDALSQQVMPRTTAFAAESLRFEQHYSGGNGTRMGVFSMFYGLYGSYWFSMLDQRKGPVLIDTLLARDYQLSVNTSAKFTYPEFDQTVFAAVDPADLHEWSGGPGWERDRAHISNVLEFIDQRDRTRPFFTFSFLESPHARYTFPEECAIMTPYLDDFNYVTMSLKDDIEGIRNRYLNACNHLDGQIARVIDYLEREDLLDNTIVVLTGDHGEEFMEKGRWGHGSTFVEEQIHVPLVLHIPEVASGRIDRLTSHVDLPATILPLLGVTNSPEELSLGLNLLGSEVRDHAVVADWSRICVLTMEAKTVLPLKAKGFFRSEVTTLNDEPWDDQQGTSIPVNVLAEVLEGMSRFRSRESLE